MKYPRRISIDRKSYTVKTRQDEEELLKQKADKARDQSKIAKYAGDEVTATRAAKKADRLESRAQSSQNNWNQYLQQEDEEILLIAA